MESKTTVVVAVSGVEDSEAFLGNGKCRQHWAMVNDDAFIRLAYLISSRGSPVAQL
jgi:hypothetical protein